MLQHLIVFSFIKENLEQIAQELYIKYEFLMYQK